VWLRSRQTALPWTVGHTISVNANFRRFVYVVLLLQEAQTLTNACSLSPSALTSWAKQCLGSCRGGSDRI
jgi:hypothetical protein